MSASPVEWKRVYKKNAPVAMLKPRWLKSVVEYKEINRRALLNVPMRLEAKKHQNHELLNIIEFL